MEPFKKTGDFFSKNSKKMGVYIKLAELEREWPRIAGPAMAERIALTACEFTQEGMLITINVNSANALPAVKSRRGMLTRALCQFLEVSEIKLDIRVGKVKPVSLAKEALPAYKRRAPLLISQQEVEEAAAVVKKEVSDPELAEDLAKIKALFEKMVKRGK